VTTKTNISPPGETFAGENSRNSHLTTEQRLVEIERLRQRLNAYVEFMCRTDGLQGTSSEAREKAVAAFHERMVALERQLGRIYEDFRLG